MRNTAGKDGAVPVWPYPASPAAQNHRASQDEPNLQYPACGGSMPPIRPASCLFRSSRGTGIFDSEPSSGHGQQGFRHEDAPSSQPVTAGSPHNTPNVPARRPATEPAEYFRRRHFDHHMLFGNWRALDCTRNRTVAGTFQRYLEGSCFCNAAVPSRPANRTESSGYWRFDGIAGLLNTLLSDSRHTSFRTRCTVFREAVGRLQ